MTDHIDCALEEYLSTGKMPDGLTADEAAEVKAMAAAAGRARTVLPHLGYEVRSTKPTARARFERFVAANPAPPSAARMPVKPKRRGLAGLFGSVPRGVVVAGSAAAIGVIALVVIFALQNVSSNTETAAAAVLTPGDYTQIEGTVTGVERTGSGRRVTLQTVLGELQIAVPDDASVVGADTEQPAANFGEGDTVLVGGVVTEERTVSARTVAVGVLATVVQRPATARELRQAPPTVVEGVIHLISIPEGTAQGILVVDTGRGRFRVPVSGATANRLLASQDRVLGARVRAERGDGERVYSVTSVTVPQTREGEANFVRITGVITRRVANVFMVETERGTVPVVVVPATRILLGESGLTLDGVRRGETAIGHTVTVQGGTVPGTRRVIADVVAVGPERAPD